jgi:hypothetical protein
LVQVFYQIKKKKGIITNQKKKEGRKEGKDKMEKVEKKEKEVTRMVGKKTKKIMEKGEKGEYLERFWKALSQKLNEEILFKKPLFFYNSSIKFLFQILLIKCLLVNITTYQ